MGFISPNTRLAGRKLATVATSLVALLAMVGCDTMSFFDPSEMGRYGKTPVIVPILRNLDTGIDEGEEHFTNATEVRPSDMIVVKNDYMIGPVDTISISVTDLVAPGVESGKVVRVSESGFISMPLIGQIKAAGMTEAQLEQAIRQAYADKDILDNAQVSVVTVEARARTFTIFGAIGQSGEYPILESDLRLLKALVLARDVTSQVGIEYVYIIRKKDQDPVDAQIEAPVLPPNAPSTQPGNDILAPRSEVRSPSQVLLTQAQDAQTQPSGAEGRIIIIDGQPVPVQREPAGQIAPLPPVPAAPGAAPASGQLAFEFNDLKEPDDLRIIRVPLGPLTRGELKYNLVIRPGDFIWVPQPTQGVYYMGGHVARTGVYSLTAQDITLRSAIISAGMLDGVAMPFRTDIVRKVGRFKKVFVRVDLAKIFSGEEPDILLKPDDEIMVGTNALAPFIAAFRGAFRITYGFGFLYDRNYAVDDTNN